LINVFYLKENCSFTALKIHIKGEDMIEEWRPIKDFDGYEVSNLGQVRSNKRSWNNAYKILCLSKSSVGYFVIRLINKNGKGYTFQVHRLVLEAFVGPPPEGDNIGHHIDGTRINNRLDNLEWSNQSKNFLASSKRYGEYHSNLKDNDIQLIRKLTSEGIRQCVIARMFKVNPGVIHKIVKYRTWKHI